ncbi:MAG: VOC family protein [Acidimicrobiales bacterium]
MPADPLQQLRLAAAPLEPRREYAAQLRRRLVRELGPLLLNRYLEEEPAVSTETAIAAPTITVALVCDDAHRLIHWMVDLLEFGVVELHESPEGKVMHARLSWRTGNVFVSDRHPGPWSRAGAMSICLAAESDAEIDRLYAKARDMGAEIIAELEDADYGSHQFGVRDPEGNLWAVGTYRPPVGPT